MSDANLEWLKKAEHWGEWIRYPNSEPGEPESIWMMKSTTNPKVRFYVIARGQIGQEHAHVVAATCWAYANGWISPDTDIGWQLACRDEVLNGGPIADRHVEPVRIL